MKSHTTLLLKQLKCSILTFSEQKPDVTKMFMGWPVFFFNEKSLASKYPQKDWTLMKRDFSDRRCFTDTYCCFFWAVNWHTLSVPMPLMIKGINMPLIKWFDQSISLPERHCSAYCFMPHPQELFAIWRCSVRAAQPFPSGAMEFVLACK